MTWGIIVGGTIAAGASVGSAAIAANNQPNPGSAGGVSDVMRFLATESRFKPVAMSSGLMGLEGQNAYGIGASPEQLALELTSRSIEQASNANEARKFQKFYADLQSFSLYKQGGGTLDAKQQKLYDKALKQVNNSLLKFGGAAALSMGADGMPSLTMADPRQQQLIEAARQDSALIQSNRLSGERQLSNLAADFPVATADQIQQWQDQYAKQIQAEISNVYGQRSEDILQMANTRGFNPAGAIGNLERLRAQDELAIPSTAAARALQLIGGQQGLAMGSISGINAALAPDATIAIMNAIRGHQTPTTGQLAMAQLAASANAENVGATNLTNSLSSSAGNLSDLGAAIAKITNENAQSEKGPNKNLNTGWGTGPGTGP